MKNSQTWAVTAVVFAILATMGDGIGVLVSCVVVAIVLSMMNAAAPDEREAGE